MKLRNAPVVQTWVSFTFTPCEQKREWDIKAAKQFLGRYRETLNHIEAIFVETYHIEEISPSRTPEVVRRDLGLDKVRARDEKATRWLQLADDRLVVNITRGSAESLNYQDLRAEALAKLDDYVAYFQPTDVEQVELHYVDIIEIPKPQNGEIKLEEYFNLRIEFPEVLGTTGRFLLHLSLNPAGGDDMVHVRFQSEPPRPDSASYTFRAEWQVVCADLGTMDSKVIGERLDRGHNRLCDYFKASVTSKTWNLFQPFNAE